MNIMPSSNVQSIGIQCSLLAAPPLKKLLCKEDVVEESIHGKTDETDLHTSSHVQEDIM